VIIVATARLDFRRMVPDDLDALAPLYADPEVRRFFPEGTLTREETREEIAWFLDGHPEDPSLGLWAAIERATGAFVGRCGLLPWEIDGKAEVEVAYLIAPPHQRRGLGTESARAIAAHAFDALGIPRVVSLVHPENVASRRVAERIGMTFEREWRDDLGLSHVYSMERPRT